MKIYTISTILITVLLSLIDAKRGGGGGGGRGSGGGGGSSSGGGWGTGGAAQAPRGTGLGAAGRPVGRPAGSGFAPSSPSRGGFSGTSLLAAGAGGALVGGLSTYAIISATNARHTSPDGVTYYYGDRYYPTGSRAPAGFIKCMFKPENGTTLNMFYNSDNTSRVTEVVFDCKLNQEMCCKDRCCQNPHNTVVYRKEEKKGLPWWGSLLIVLLLIGLIGGVGYCVYSQVRKSAVQNDNVYPEATYTVYQTDQYQQPNQPYAYPNQGPPPQAAGYYGDNAPYAQATPGGAFYPQQPPPYPAQPQNYPQGPPAQNYGFNTQPYLPTKHP